MEKNTGRKRAKNFTDAERDILVEEVEKRREVLFGPLKGPKLTQWHRDRAWEQVQNAVNSVAPTTRSVTELKAKFKDLKKRVKHKANAIRRDGRKTGGGINESNTPLSATEHKLVQFIGTESIEGIVGGIDTFRHSVVNKPSTSKVLDEAELDTDNTEVPASPLPGTISPVYDEIPTLPSSPLLTRPIPVPRLLFPRSNNTGANKTNSSTSNPVPVSLPPVPPKRGKKRAKSLALEEIRKTTELQQNSNRLLQELITEVRSIKEVFVEFVNIKKLELELMNENIEMKKRKLE